METKNQQGMPEPVHHAVKVSQKLRVKVGDLVTPGQKLVEGPIIINDLLEKADTRAVQNYLLKEVQRLYRLQGIAIADKYIEIIIRQMLSKIIITDPGDSDFFTGSLVDRFIYQRENGRLIAQGKRPAFGEVKIKGAKQTPLLSDSFLAAASYQETAKILVNSSISNRVDYLQGLKENIILGYKIPAGTNSNYDPKSKYDIRDPKSYFTNKSAAQEIPTERIVYDIDNLFDNVSLDEVELYEDHSMNDSFDDEYDNE